MEARRRSQNDSLEESPRLLRAQSAQIGEMKKTMQELHVHMGNPKHETLEESPRLQRSRSAQTKEIKKTMHVVHKPQRFVEKHLDHNFHIDKPREASQVLLEALAQHPEDEESICSYVVKKLTKKREKKVIPLFAALMESTTTASLMETYLKSALEPRLFLRNLFQHIASQNKGSLHTAIPFIVDCTKRDLASQSMHSLFRGGELSSKLGAACVRVELEHELLVLRQKIHPFLKNPEHVKQCIIQAPLVEAILAERDASFASRDIATKSTRVGAAIAERQEYFAAMAKAVVKQVYAMELSASCKQLLTLRRRLIASHIAENDTSQDARTTSRSVGELLFLRVINPFLTSELSSGLPQPQQADVNGLMLGICTLLQSLTNQVRLSETKPHATVINALYDELSEAHCAFLDAATTGIFL